jgi:uncharacterized protein involved in outer membrane biogenesis
LEDVVLNTLYISIGGAILLALIVALIGPLFVDWTSYRAAFEREASLALGQPVRVLGTADMQILPLPHLQFGTVHVGPNKSEPLLVVDQFDVRIELLPLLKGEIDVVDMTLTSPQLRLHVDEGGETGWKAAQKSERQVNPKQIKLNNVVIKDGHLLVRNAQSGQQFDIRNFNGTVNARSLFGPYKIESSFSVKGEPYSLMISSGRASGDEVRVKSLLTPANIPVTLAMDGAISKTLDYRGDVKIQNVVDASQGSTPWSLEGKASFSPQALRLDQFAFLYGPEEQSYRVNGRGFVDLGREPNFGLELASRQLDLDRSLGQGPNAPIDLRQALSAFGGLLHSLPKPKMNGQIKFEVPSVILGGGILQNLLLDAKLANKGEQGAWQIESLEADLPGASRVAVSGLYSDRQIGEDTQFAFEGEGRLRSDQPAVFAKWWLKDAPQQGRLVPFDLSGRILLKPGQFSLSNVTLDLEGDQLEGRLDWLDGKEQIHDTASGMLDVSMKADRLNVDVIQSLGDLLLAKRASKGDRFSNITLDIAARHLLSGDFSGRDLAAKLHVSSGVIDIEQLSVKNLEGADVSATGKLEDLTGDPKGYLTGTLVADKLTGLTGLVSRLMPDHGLSRWLERSQSALEPADLAFSVSGRNQGQTGSADGASRGLDGTLSGKVGGGTLSLEGEIDGALSDWTSSPANLSLKLDYPKGQKLLTLLGGDGLGLSLPQLEAQMSLSGILQEGAKLESRILASDGGFEFQGQLTAKPQAHETSWSAQGDVAVQSDDALPFLNAFGLPAGSIAAALPADLSATLAYEGETLSLSAIQGSWDRQPILGDVTYRTGLSGHAIEGALELGDIDGIWLGETLLGAGRLTSLDKNWPDLAFVAPPRGTKDEALRLSLDIKGRSLELSSPYIFQKPQFNLIWRQGGLAVRDFKALLHGGEVSAGLQLDNLEGEGVLKGHVQTKDVALAPLIWQRDGRSVASGLFDATLDLEAQGRSLAGMVSSLSGNGTFALKEATLRYFNPEAFGLVMRAVDAGLELEDAAIAKAFAAHMDAGSMDVKRLDGAFRIAGGTLRAGNMRAETDLLRSRGNLVLDLNQHSLDGDWSIATEPKEEDAVTGAVPEVGVIFSGDLSNPVRRIDVAPFTGYLSIRAFEKEVDRIEAMQADILEKEGFRRKLKLYRQEAKHRELEAIAARKAAEKAAQAAKEAEAKRKAEEAKRRAEEELRIKEQKRKEREEAERKAEEARRAEQERQAEERRLEEERERQRLEKERIEQLRQQQKKPLREWINPDEIEVKPLSPLGQAPLQPDLRNNGNRNSDPIRTGGIIQRSVSPASFAETAPQAEQTTPSILLPRSLGTLPKQPARSSPVLYERGNDRDLFNRLRQSPDLIIRLD